MKAMNSHCLKWGPLPLNDGRIAQHVREGEIRKGFNPLISCLHPWRFFCVCTWAVAKQDLTILVMPLALVQVPSHLPRVLRLSANVKRG